MFDWYANSQQLKCLTVTDEFNEEGLTIDVDARNRSARVIAVLSRLVTEHGAPAYLRSDNGPQFVLCALLSWIHDTGYRRHRDDRSVASRGRTALARAPTANSATNT